MQVLAGKYRGKHLQSSTSPRVRPTARRLRETLFEILGAHVEGARVLDLCAGSGAIGIEALSRGASHGARRTQSPTEIVHTGSRSAAVTPYGARFNSAATVFSAMARTRLTGIVRPAGRRSPGGPRCAVSHAPRAR